MEFELPLQVKVNQKIAGYKAGDTITVKTERELESALVYHRSGVMTVPGAKPRKTKAAKTSSESTSQEQSSKKGVEDGRVSSKS